MYVVVQKTKLKKPDKHGASKRLDATSFSFSINGETYIKYSYSYSDEKFERLNHDAYKISIHKSYREGGKVKKKQWVITTVSYYSLVEWGLWDCVNHTRLEDKLHEMGLTENEFWDMLDEKMQPLIDQLTAEFQQSEEYQTKQKHRAIVKAYTEAEQKFEDTYGSGSYGRCYDVFGELRNPEYLKQLKAAKKASEEYQQRSYQYQQQSNYDWSGFGGYSNIQRSNYTEDEREKLKQITRVLVKKFHPDVGGDQETMKLVNRLKEEWGV